MNIEPKKITFSWTKKEWHRANWAEQLYDAQHTVLLYGGSILLIVNIYAILCRYNSNETFVPLREFLMMAVMRSIAAALTVGLITLLAMYTRVSSAVARYRRSPENFTDTSWEIDDDGLTYLQQKNRIHIPWKAITKVLWINEYLVIRYYRVGNFALPRSSFSDGGKAWYDTINEKIQVSKKMTSK